MPPNTFIGLLLFVWLITPGFLFSWKAAKRRALHTETVLQEVSRIVLASVLFSTLAGLIVITVDLAVGRRGTVLSRAVAADPEVWRTEAATLLGYLLLQVLLACGLALLADRLIRWRVTKKRGTPPPQLRSESSWTEALGQRPVNAAPHAYLRLKSGVELQGKVAAFTHDLVVDDRELVLTAPLWIRPPDGSLQELRWGTVIIRGPDIDCLAVRYQRETPAANQASKHPPRTAVTPEGS